MSSRNGSESSTPYWRQRQRKIEIRREAKRRRSLEAREQQATPRREGWVYLRNELEENNRSGPARSPIITRNLNGNGSREQNQASHDLPQQGSRPDVSDSDALAPEGPVSTAGVAVNPPVGAENVGGSDADDKLEESDESDEANSSDEDGEADVSDNPSATFPGVRWISKKYLTEQRFWGMGIYSAMYQSKATDALYFLSNLGEKIWLTDENGDAVLAQDQNMDRTTKPSSDEADP